MIIIGAGVAGCAAAITARQRGLSVLALYAGDGDLAKAKSVDNYPGLPNMPGAEVLGRMRDHAQMKGAVLIRSLVRRVMPSGGDFSVLAGNDLFEAKSIILAMGTTRVRTLPGEEELVGQGVSYCATCDGMFYRGGEVLVVASGGDSVEEANYLAGLAKVTYCKEKPHDTVHLSGDVTVSGAKPLSFSLRGEKIALATSEGELLGDGAFVMRPAVAMTQLIPEAETEKGALRLDAKLMTSVPGIFAAGDVAGLPYQAAKAAGEGTVAALSAAAWLAREKGVRPAPKGEQW
ncbi:MAG TPA: FAD-dependent oxidoreductase [Candidatus Limnocylindria bacterium]|nr:FAD-dependent oxidoreductase [Candidatus Limnocylindria bacterium]